MLIKGKQLRDKTIEQDKLNLVTPILPADAATKEYVDQNAGSIERYSDKNFDMLALPTASTAGDQLATATPLLEDPSPGSGVNVFINGIQSNIYTVFKSPAGVVRAFGEEQIGDLCYWTRDFVNYDLSSDDLIDFVYIVSIGSSGTSGGSGPIIPGTADGVVDTATLQGTILHLGRTLDLADVTVDLASISAVGTSGNVISGTYLEIKNLKDNNQLLQGKYYRITDFQTIYQIPNTNVINTGFIEELVVLAIFNNAFADRVYSVLFLNDFILYDFDNNLAEDSLTSRPGKIIFREDPNIGLSTYYDWRNVKFRRWNVLGFVYEPVQHIAGTADYFVSSISFTATSYQDFYINFGTNTHLANPSLNLDPVQAAGAELELVKPGNISFVQDELLTYLSNNIAWVHYSPQLNKYVVIEADIVGNDPSGGSYVKGYNSWRNNSFIIGNNHQLDVDIADFVDMYTFGNTSNGGNLMDISIQEMNNSTLYNNIVFTTNSANIKQISFGENCSNMTFSNSNFTGLKLKDECTNNLFTADAAWANIDNEFQDNLVIGDLLRYLKTESETYNTTWISFGSILHHHYKGLLQNNTFRFGGSSGSGFLYFDGYFQSNYIYWPSANRNHIIGDMWNHSWEISAGWSNITYLSNYSVVTNFSSIISDKVLNAILHDYLNDPALDPNFGDNSIVNKKYVDDSIVSTVGLTLANKNEIPNLTTGNNADTGISITNTPTGFVAVYVDGVLVDLGDGILSHDCYFSDDGGTTAKSIVDIVETNTLYWNGTIVGADLDATNRIDFLYI